MWRGKVWRNGGRRRCENLFESCLVGLVSWREMWINPDWFEFEGRRNGWVDGYGLLSLFHTVGLSEGQFSAAAHAAAPASHPFIRKISLFQFNHDGKLWCCMFTRIIGLDVTRTVFQLSSSLNMWYIVPLLSFVLNLALWSRRRQSRQETRFLRPPLCVTRWDGGDGGSNNGRFGLILIDVDGTILPMVDGGWGGMIVINYDNNW